MGNTTQYTSIGVDVGTGSARACVVDEGGILLAHASQPIRQWQSYPGAFEQSTSDIWRSICAAVREALGQGNVDSSTITGIGFAATCSLAVFTHDTDEPVSMTGPSFDGDDRNIILWLDRRADEETKTINAIKHPLFRYLGGSISVEMALPKILWLQNHMSPELFRRCQFYDLSDALDHLATGEKRRRCTTACEHGRDSPSIGIDGTVKGWQSDFYNDIGLGTLADSNFLQIGGVCEHGRPSRPGSHVGSLSEKAATELGLPQGIAVAAGVIDAFAGWIGTVGVQDTPATTSVAPSPHQRLAVVAGTSTCFLATAPEPHFAPGIWGPYADFLLQKTYMAEGGQPATGALLSHITSTHPASQLAAEAAQAAGQDIYDLLDATLSRMQQDAHAPHIAHLARHMHLYGDIAGNRSPHGSPHAVIALVAPPAAPILENLALYYYGALEFLALQTRQILAAMNTAGYDARALYVCGSQARNETFMHLLADVCGIPVVLPRYPHAAVCCGAAILGAVAAGDPDGEVVAGADANGGAEVGDRSSSLWAAMTRLTRPGRSYQPSSDQGLRDLLEVKYGIFLEQCEHQQRFRSMVDEVVAQQ